MIAESGKQYYDVQLLCTHCSFWCACTRCAQGMQTCLSLFCNPVLWAFRGTMVTFVLSWVLSKGAKYNGEWRASCWYCYGRVCSQKYYTCMVVASLLRAACVRPRTTTRRLLCRQCLVVHLMHPPSWPSFGVERAWGDAFSWETRSMIEYARRICVGLVF